MNAVTKWHSIRQQVLDDARYIASGRAHLEPPEAVRWIEETGDHDIAGAMSEALSDSDDKPRDRWCLLMTELCQLGEDLPIRKALELLDLQRSILTDKCIADAQRMVDRELP